MNPSGRIDLRINGLIAHWKQQDPPPSRVSPVPLDIYVIAINMCRAVNDPVYDCLADMLIIAFFFLCRPGECTAGTRSCRPFRYQDVCLYAGALVLNLLTATLSEMQASTFSTLMFTNQKNAVPGEVIGQGRTTHSIMNVCVPLANRIHYLRFHNAPLDLPLCSHLVNGRWHVITAAQFTAVLRAAVSIGGAKYGLYPHQVSARSTRSSGAMAMMCGGVDTSRRRLQGRWKSDVMFRYLMVQHAPLCADIGQRMVDGGNFDTIPTAIGPTDPNADAILEQPAATVAAMAATVASHNPQA